MVLPGTLGLGSWACRGGWVLGLGVRAQDPSGVKVHSNGSWHLPNSSLISERHRRHGMAARSPLHRVRDASASREPSTHSLHCFTACNTALPSHKIEKAFLVLSGPRGAASRSRGGPPRPRGPSHLRAPHALMLGPRRWHADGPCACRRVIGFLRWRPCGMNGRDRE